ncbi:MAG: helix-turn-helix transcriptional regulator [Candidatus Obscuribacterales bacterium]
MFGKARILGKMRIDEKLLYQKLGEELKKRRKGIPLSQEQLAKEVGIERTSVTNIEAGRQKAPLHVLYEVCKVLGVELTDLLPASGEVSQEQPVLLDIVEAGIKMSPKSAELYKEIQNE